MADQIETTGADVAAVWAPLDDDLVADVARRHDAATIAARLSRLLGRWAGGERTPLLRVVIADWRSVRAARTAQDRSPC